MINLKQSVLKVLSVVASDTIARIVVDSNGVMLHPLVTSCTAYLHLVGGFIGPQNDYRLWPC